MGAPLEDARHLAQRYDRMRQEAEAQVISICITLLHNKFTFTFCLCILCFWYQAVFYMTLTDSNILANLA